MSRYISMGEDNVFIDPVTVRLCQKELQISQPEQVPREQQFCSYDLIQQEMVPLEWSNVKKIESMVENITDQMQPSALVDIRANVKY